MRVTHKVTTTQRAHHLWIGLEVMGSGWVVGCNHLSTLQYQSLAETEVTDGQEGAKCEKAATWRKCWASSRGQSASPAASCASSDATDPRTRATRRPRSCWPLRRGTTSRVMSLYSIALGNEDHVSSCLTDCVYVLFVVDDACRGGGDQIPTSRFTSHRLEAASRY